MDHCADLEIKLHRLEGQLYTVELRSAIPGSETVAYVGSGDGCTAEFDQARLLAVAHDQVEYGRQLTAGLFADDRVRATFASSKAEAQAVGLPLRVRLVMEADELHGLHWETLVDPDDQDSVLAMSERIRLSRYPTSSDRERIRLRRRTQLRALVVAANPAELSRLGLAEVDVAGEHARVTSALKDIPVDVLPDVALDGTAGNATLTNVLDRLRTGHHDILYIVCHGGVYEGEPKLWLEPEEGHDHRGVAGSLLADGIKQLDVRPRLVVLASCDSAGPAIGDALGAIGPQLAEAGIPAVLAMQGKIEMQTIERFMPTFFSELAVDGEIDRAVAVARRAVWNQPDHWMPALFMRLATGHIWSTGFGAGADARRSWTNVATNIQAKECTPVLGPNLLEPLVGPRQAVARALAERYQYPLGDADRDRLHRVEQYVKTSFLPDQLEKARRQALRDVLVSQFAEQLPESARDTEIWNASTVVEAMGAVLDHHLGDQPDGPHRRLARLRLPIYVDASPHDAMARALVLEGADPVVRMCPWYPGVPDGELHLCEDKPTPDRPLVYHLFGRTAHPESLVMGEDGFYDYLLGVSRNFQLIPKDVRAALVSTSLLILGFRLDDPEFRVVFRFIMTREGRDLLRRRQHAAVQIEPSDDLVTDVGLAHEFFEKYFTGEGFNPYWGTSQEFIEELAESIP